MTWPAIRSPKGVDPQWQEKIAQAKKARAMAAKLREGKPKSFRPAVGRTFEAVGPHFSTRSIQTVTRDNSSYGIMKRQRALS